jgi:pectate lyase
MSIRISAVAALLVGALPFACSAYEVEDAADVDASRGGTLADDGASTRADARPGDDPPDASLVDAKGSDRTGDAAGIDGARDDRAVIDASREAPGDTTARDMAVADVGEAGRSDAVIQDVASDATSDGGKSSGPAVALDAKLRFQRIDVRVAGTSSCITPTAANVGLMPCGAASQDLRVSLLGLDHLALVEDATGRCLTAESGALVMADCTNSAAQQFAWSGTSAGYRFVSLESKVALGTDARLGGTAGSFEIHVRGDADALAVVVDERPIGWATMPAKIVVPGTAPPTGNEQTRDAAPTTGGGTWEAARAKSFANVAWFKPSDFAGSGRETAIAAVANALRAAGPSVILFEEGTYDFALFTPKKVNRCNATCASGATYPQTGGFCPDDATCATTAGCVVGGYSDPYRTLDVGSDKTILGLGGGAIFRRLGLRFMGQHNVIYRNVAHREMPGGVRAWDDGLLFWPADHVWLDHLSFSGFGRGAIVLSGTRVPDGSSFYTWRDSGWFTFSWTEVDSSESWRCNDAEDSPYPFFTTADPSLTFHHALFTRGHGRNPAIDMETAHFFNCAWSNVSDGLNGRNGAELLVEGSYFDGNRPIRVEAPHPPIVLAPIDPASPRLGDKRRLNVLSARADASLQSDWKGRGLDVQTLDTNAVVAPSYPYSLDADPSRTRDVVTAGAGAGKGGFPSCQVDPGTKTYRCR